MRRYFVLGLSVTMLVLVSSGASADPPATELQLVAGYAAKETCSCVFVEQQTDAYCINYGTVPTGETVVVTIDHTANTVTASFLATTRIASFTSGQGCVLAAP